MYHEPVLLKESVDGLNINPDGCYFDATFGGGGHSREILKRLSHKGKLFAIDQDSDAKNNIIDDERFTFIFGNFRYLKNYIEYYHIQKIDGLLADFGVSSHQFDEKDRGFSFRLGGNLDMRMNDKQKLSAVEILNSYDESKLLYIFNNYCDINNSKRLSERIITYRENKKIDTIEDFLYIITPLAQKFKENKYFAQVFQAVRIAVNDEMIALEEFLNSIPQFLRIGARLSFISYHSLEDVRVKNLIRYGSTIEPDNINIFGNKPSCLTAINRKAIIPSDEELERNPRSKSAKLRIAEKNERE